MTWSAPRESRGKMQNDMWPCPAANESRATDFPPPVGAQRKVDDGGMPDVGHVIRLRWVMEMASFQRHLSSSFYWVLGTSEAREACVKWYRGVVGADMVRNGVLIHGSIGGGHHERRQQQQQEITLFSSVLGGSQNALPRGWADRRLPFQGVSSSVQPVIIIAYTISNFVYTRWIFGREYFSLLQLDTNPAMGCNQRPVEHNNFYTITYS
jgi:hypothetical protein